MTTRQRPFLKFLGTGGGRWVMTRQLRATGGFWIGYCATRIHVDPGPGALVRCHRVRPRLNPEDLDAILISHRHLDHCNDASVLIEAMTRFGTRPRGQVLLPEDALRPHSVLFPHVLAYLPTPPVVLAPQQRHRVGDIVVQVGPRHRHPVETYGFLFEMGEIRLAYIADTAFFEGLIPAYRGATVVVISMTLVEPRPGVDHLASLEALELLSQLRPRAAVLTHFGASVLQQRPWEWARAWSRQLGFPILAATDGRFLDLEALASLGASGG